MQNPSIHTKNTNTDYPLQYPPDQGGATFLLIIYTKKVQQRQAGDGFGGGMQSPTVRGTGAKAETKTGGDGGTSSRRARMQAHSGVKGGRSHVRGLAAGTREPTDQVGAG